MPQSGETKILISTKIISNASKSKRFNKTSGSNRYNLRWLSDKKAKHPNRRRLCSSVPQRRNLWFNFPLG